VTVEVAEVLKGKAAKTLRFTVVHSGAGDTPAKWKADGVELILFLEEDAGTLSLRSGTFGWWDSAVRLDGKPERGVFTADLRRLTKAKDVLRAARNALAELPMQETPKRHLIDVPPGTDVSDALYGGSAVYLVVPVDDTLQAVARNWLKAPATKLADGHLRLEGVRALRHFRSDENAGLLKPLLADPYSWTTTDQAGQRKRVYPVRREAHDVLTSWGVEVNRPLVEEDVQ
jgi:hypothetical protein